MAIFGRKKYIVETPQDARQAENSKDPFNVLWASLILAVLAGVGLILYFQAIPLMTQTTSHTTTIPKSPP